MNILQNMTFLLAGTAIGIIIGYLRLAQYLKKRYGVDVDKLFTDRKKNK